MPRLGQNDDMNVHSIGGSNFQFSAKKIDELDASEYTLVVVAADVSGSMDGFGDDMDKMLGAIVEACRDPKNPRADNMMLRVLLFNENVQEIHGFRPVMDLNPDDYKGICNPGSMTAARDAAYSGAKSMTQYAQDLVAKQYAVNGALFLITDGIDNRSKVSAAMLKEALTEGIGAEALESVMSALIGMGHGSAEELQDVSDYLKVLYDEGGFGQYEFAGKCTPAVLARIGGFVSKSASSQSQALGTGGASQSLSF